MPSTLFRTGILIAGLVLARLSEAASDVSEASIPAGPVEAVLGPGGLGPEGEKTEFRDGELPVPNLLCRKVAWLVLPGVFVLPETGPGVALKAHVRNLLGVPGYVDVTTIATWKRQADFEAAWLRDSIGGVWRTRQRVEVGRFPSLWYGVGNPPPDSMRARYEPVYLIAETRLARYVLDGWALEVGLGFDAEHMRHRDEGAFLAQPTLASDGGTFWIGGAAIEYEGRDLPENPRHGPFLRVQDRTALPGSYSVWTQWQNDASWTESVGPLTAVVRARTLSAWGDVPFWETPWLGFRDAMRGLPNRRLRGESVHCSGLELRWNLPRFWGAGWQLASFFEEGRSGTHRGVWTAMPMGSGGGGIRLLLDEGKAVLRADFGVSGEGHGTYLDFGQAF